MKRIGKFSLIVVVLTLLLGCDSEKGLNCFQASGEIIQEEMSLPFFDKVIVWERTQLIISQGETQKVVVETGANLFNDVEVKVKNQQLEIINNNGCNLARDYGLTKVFITVPNLTEIRNSSGLPVESRGVLKFPNLVLTSEDRENEDQFHIDGDFILTVECENLELVATGLSNFFLTGTADRAYFAVFSGDVRIEAANLIVNDVAIYHRGTNKIIVNPQERLTGRIVNSGDVISKNRPPVVEVEALYRGRLIFE